MLVVARHFAIVLNLVRPECGLRSTGRRRWPVPLRLLHDLGELPVELEGAGAGVVGGGHASDDADGVRQSRTVAEREYPWPVRAAQAVEDRWDGFVDWFGHLQPVIGFVVALCLLPFVLLWFSLLLAFCVVPPVRMVEAILGPGEVVGVRALIDGAAILGWWMLLFPAMSWASGVLRVGPGRPPEDRWR